jgi:hypothetical protein
MRATIDKLVSWTGLVLAIVLLVAGGLLTYASVFIGNQVHDQLAAQHISMPTAEQYGELSPADQAALKPYAGQQMTTGAQAQAYADHFIAVHLREIGGGKTYAQLSAAALANPKNTALAEQVQTIFRGETLRGLLLNAYGWWQMAQIMLIGAIVAFVAAAALLILSLFGIAHRRHVSAEAEVFGARAAPAHKTAPAV